MFQLKKKSNDLFGSKKESNFIAGQSTTLSAHAASKAKWMIGTYLFIFAVMWVNFFLQQILPSSYTSFFGGINPRHFTLQELASIFSSWAFHGNMEHIKSNSIGLLGLLWGIVLLEAKPIRVLLALIATSGIATWILGASGSAHIGASGLIFAIFGFILGSAVFRLKVFYMLWVAAAGSAFYYSITHGLVPDSGVSMAAHLGGLVAGLVVAWFSRKSESKSSTYVYAGATAKPWYKRIFSK